MDKVLFMSEVGYATHRGIIFGQIGIFAKGVGTIAVGGSYNDNRQKTSS